MYTSQHLPSDAATAGKPEASGASSPAVETVVGESPPAAPSTADVLKGREAAGLPLMRPSVPHEIQRAPKQTNPGLPLPGPQAYPLSSGPQGMRLKSRDLLE